MLGVYSKPVCGFMSLNPVCDLGHDAAVALWRAGIRKGQRITRARGLALLVLGGGASLPIQLPEKSRQGARRVAIGSTANGEVVLLEASYRGRFTVYRRLELLKAMSPSEADRDGALSLVSPSGYLIEKTLSPADPVDAKKIANRLTGQLLYEERKVFGPKLAEYVSKMKVDWPNLTANQMNEQLSKVRTDLKKMMGASADKLFPTWKTKVESTIKNIFTGTRKTIRSNFLPNVGLSMRQPDLAAVKAIGEQQGWWMRNASGMRCDRLTAQARKIVQQGLTDGLGRTEIAANLMDSLPNAWQAMGQRYFSSVASVAVARGRSYSEVSGYIEVGIESLEVQAVLDERTTDICRCLDGTIIDTNVVSEQIVGAMNVTTPEDIRDASPFLKEVTNRETGFKDIVTSNSGDRIAEVVRSGFGNVDDRGQFNTFVSGNQLVDLKIGPPPYHFECRSYTVPVMSSVQVPRNFTPQADETPPVPPRVVPEGGTPPPGVGARPQVMNPTPTPEAPTLIGNQDITERYPFSKDFATPPELPVDLYYHPKQLKDGAVYQRHYFDSGNGVIRPAGPLATVPKPTDAENFLKALADNLSLGAEVRGVTMYVDSLDFKTLRDIILAESKQAIAANRVYSLRGTLTDRQHFLRFNPAKKSSEAVKSALSELGASDSLGAATKAMAKLEDAGYLLQATKAEKLTSGIVSSEKLPPLKGPGIPKPKPIPKPAPGATTIPKPKPAAVVEPTMPYGQARQWTPARDYTEHGLLPEIPVEQQMAKRVEMETAKLRDYLAAKEKASPGGLSYSGHADAIRDYVTQSTGAVEKITSKMVRSNMSVEIPHGRQAAEHSTMNNVRKGTMALAPGSKISDVVLKTVPDEELASLYNKAFQHLSQRVLDATLKKGFPKVFYAEGVSGGAFYNSGYRVMVLPGKVKNAGELERYFRHEFGHYVDSLGQTKHASAAFRDRYKTSEKVFTSSNGYDYVPGKWGDEYSGMVDSKWKYNTEINSTISESMSENSKIKLNNMHAANPDHVGYFISQAKGDFIP